MKKQKAKSIFKGFLSLMLVAAMLVGFTTPMMSMEANAAVSQPVSAEQVLERLANIKSGVYGVKKYFRNDQSKSCCKPNGTACHGNHDGFNYIDDSFCNCKVATADIAGTAGGIQCFGYARYVFYQLFGKAICTYQKNNYTLGSTTNVSILGQVLNGSSTSTANLLSQAKAGDFIQAQTKYGNMHSMIVDTVSETEIKVLECNHDGQCYINNRTETYSNFAAQYPKFTVYRADNYPSGSTPPTHTHSYTSVVTAPTCENKGYTTHTCSCEDSYVDSYVDALGHNYVGTVSKNATCTEKGTTTYKCSRCTASYTEDDIAALGHDYDDEVITKPTCKEEGLMSHTCSRCSDNYTEAIPAKGHNYDNPVWVTTVSATCASEGEQAGYCPDCGDLIKTRSTKALGHEIGKWVVSVQPTCTSAGEEQCYCSRCGEVIDTRAIKALGHDEGTWVVTKKATCIDEGEEVCFCTRCGKAIDERKTDALGHDEGVWKIDFEPTADHDGQMSLYCTRCNCVLESKTFKLHKHVEGYRETVIEPTCTTEGEGGVFCAECGAKFDTYSIPALGHIYSEWYTNKNGTHSKICSRCHDLQIENCHYDAVVTAPTCNDGGYTTYTCADCGHSYISDYVAALGHDWSGWTEDENGQTHSRTCANCGESETEEHNWNDWVYNKDATLCKNGTKTRTCQDCGASETEKSIHTAWLCRIPYTIVLWIGNLLKKALYIVSLDWLLPWLNITPVH